MTAIFVPGQLPDFPDFPSSYTGQGLKAVRVNSGATALEFFTLATGYLPPNWVSVMDYGASGVTTTTTLGANLTGGSTQATLANASSFAQGHGMAIPGAGTSGAELIVTLTAPPNGNVVTFTPATVTSVLSGINIFHDDTTAFLNAIASLKHVFVPDGNYNTTQSLVLSTSNQKFIGNGWGSSTIWCRRGNIQAVSVTAASKAWVEHLGIGLDANTTPASGGCGIHIGSASSSVGSNVIQNVHINPTQTGTTGFYQGMIMDGHCVNNFFYRIMIARSKTDNYYINCVSPGYGFGQMTECVSYHSSADGAGTIGLHVAQCDTARIKGMVISGSESPLWIKGDTGPVYNQMYTNMNIENKYNSNGAVIQIGNGANTVQGCCLTNIETNPTGAPGYWGVILGSNSNKCIVNDLIMRSGSISNTGTGNVIGNYVSI